MERLAGIRSSPQIPNSDSNQIPQSNVLTEIAKGPENKEDSTPEPKKPINQIPESVIESNEENSLDKIYSSNKIDKNTNVETLEDEDQEDSDEDDPDDPKMFDTNTEDDEDENEEEELLNNPPKRLDKRKKKLFERILQ